MTKKQVESVCRKVKEIKKMKKDHMALIKKAKALEIRHFKKWDSLQNTLDVVGLDVPEAIKMTKKDLKNGLKKTKK